MLLAVPMTQKLAERHNPAILQSENMCPAVLKSLVRGAVDSSLFTEHYNFVTAIDELARREGAE